MPDQVNWDVSQFDNKLDSDIMKRLDRSAMFVEGRAKEYCPVVTSTAKRSITREPLPAILTVRVGSNVKYFKYFELGTPTQAAQYPLTRGLEDSRMDIKAQF